MDVTRCGPGRFRGAPLLRRYDLLRPTCRRKEERVRAVDCVGLLCFIIEINLPQFGNLTDLMEKLVWLGIKKCTQARTTLISTATPLLV